MHTLGPWKVEHLWNGLIAIDDTSGRHIATIEKHNVDAITPGPNGIQEAAANARLIAAAPALVDALESALADAEAYFHLAPDRSKAAIRKRCDSYRATIKLAKEGA